MSESPLVRKYEESGALIAGGTSGVGLASALGLAAAGVPRLVLVGRDAERGDGARRAVLDQYPDVEVTFVSADATDESAVDRAVSAAHDRLGSVDICISSTTTAYKPELLHRTPAASMSAILTGQALPPMLFTRAVLPLMQDQGGGSIINIASDAAKVPTPGESVLGAAMAAIVMFTRVVAVEAKRNGIRVNAVTPSLIEGTRTADNVLRDGFSRSLFEKAAGQAHLGVAVPDDLASLIVFLAGPGAARLTGQTVSVNGGISAF
ncbi:putative oxidoreductase [Gordonia polyisoprenivorans NBRC 16320 = JCM 10675]|uniref:SDR family oxidoreductase n=1 Tax=Gordonia polyisoprenivorans TaxID=84595 RepID=A0A846WI95_9ACTN|nr:SDR family oxidoreductase [Gordonia polyisoprenivorans]NKY01452.1 SDR family oxidoreductase [Gordonia polyisoprenivorans]GAB26333.1 putative oxidoreductase [Gordonia polyisoprenivorans NBRC 16320 = JCM 10675]